MNKFSMLMCLFLCCSMSHSHDTPTSAQLTNHEKKKLHQKIFINVNPTIRNNCLPTQINHQNSAQNTAQHNQQNQSSMQKMYNKLTNTINISSYLNITTAKELSKKTGTKLLVHKKKCIAGATTGIYLLACYSVVKANQYLGHATLWSSWHYEHSLATLYAMPQDKLAQDLLLEIQKRYTTPDDPTEFMIPLIKFLYEIDLEIKRLRFYTTAARWINNCKLDYILPINRQRFTNVHDRLKRALLFKNTFLTWAAHYKMDHNKHFVINEIEHGAYAYKNYLKKQR